MIGPTELVIILSVVGGLAAAVVVFAALLAKLVANRLEGRR